MKISEVLIVNPSSAIQDLFCGVCTEFSTNPFQTSCGHLYCDDCIRGILKTSKCCPMDRTAISLSSIKPLKLVNPLLRRIWNGVKIRCPNCFSDDCSWVGSPEEFENHVTNCEKKPTRSEKNVKLYSLLVTLDPEYCYDNQNIPELCHLMLQHRVEYDHIDTNRIFNCIRNILNSYRREYESNPIDIRIQVEMLLSIARYCNWFTPKQSCHFQLS